MIQARYVTFIPYYLLGFGGCMKDVQFAQGAVVNLASVSSGAIRVNLDGCLSTDSAVNCRGNDSILVYRGEEQSVYESGLQPFTGNVEMLQSQCPTSPPRPLFPPCQPTTSLHESYVNLLLLTSI